MSAVGHGLGMGVYAVFAVTGLSIILTTNIYFSTNSNSWNSLFYLFMVFYLYFKKIRK